MAKEIKLSELRKFVDDGMKVEELAAEYELPKSQVRKLLKEAGLKIRKLKKDSAFKLIDDTKPEEETQAEQEETITKEVPADLAPEVPEAAQTAEIPTPENPAPEVSQDNGTDTFGW